MLSIRETELHEKINKQYNIYKFPQLKRKKNGLLDMRYNENIKIFSQEYKLNLLEENRKHNRIYDGPINCYRKDILKMTERELKVMWE